MLSSRLIPATLFAASLSCVSASAADPIGPNEFATLHALIKPAPSEWKWAAIPWQTSLWEARRKAAEEGKPLLLWEMDGNPLGCT
jgi:hypothetical protein